MLNQCPHNLDLWQWICGMPVKVLSNMHFGKWHNIEVEDDVTTYVEYANGATGTFTTLTGDAPGTNRFEILCDKGKLVSENGKLLLWKNKVSEREFCFSCKEGFALPENEFSQVETDGQSPQHCGVLNAFASAILHGTPLVADGTEGINGLTLSNAAYLSSWKNNCRVDLPFDCDEFESHLNALRKNEISSSENNGFKNPEDKYSSRWKVNW